MKKTAHENKIDWELVRQRVQAARQMSGMAQGDANKALGWSSSGTLCKYERIEHRKKPSLELLVNMADLYGVTLDYLLGRSGYPDGDPETTHQACIMRSLKERMNVFTKEVTTHLLTYAQHDLSYKEQLIALNAGLTVLIEKFDRFRLVNKVQYENEMSMGSALDAAFDRVRGDSDQSKLFIKRMNVAEQSRQNAFRLKEVGVHDLFDEVIDSE